MMKKPQTAMKRHVISFVLIEGFQQVSSGEALVSLFACTEYL
jgi:hypothetical protein